ncbi:MAG TPA: type VI secretion system baseplate subunit TssF [Pseudomonas sp.]|uniref:type VI secretion system baseplate subunit TssF n=1 Tax=Pseudomonas sp. TaxID=306 RepID=UPI002B7BAF89|nr:type VI secretion system baseplate subunit TssF [Pseudomonas sp.]HSX86952.1 type VI secretion system baseplate subunit TssF [Pseudomonas sp.]
MSDSIDEELLDYYQRELTWLRQAGAGFAERYPKIASRLELSAGECPDPHVERLLESFSLLSARLQRRLDDGYAEFSDALLEQLYPLALRPLPSCAIARFEPDPSKGNLSEGYSLPRDTPLFVTTTAGDSIYFRSTAPVTLWPLEVADAVLLDTEETQALTGVPLARAALRLSLRNVGEEPWSALPIETLRIHLGGSPVIAAVLYDLLCGNALRTLCGVPGSQPRAVGGCPEPVGFGDDEALLPDEDGLHPGLRLLAEYFACPEKFAFFDIPIGVPADAVDWLDVYILFDRTPSARLSLRKEDIVLGCAPVINLFPRTSEPLRPDGTRSEYRLIADAYRENSTEIHSIRNLRAGAGQRAQWIAPYYACQHGMGEGRLFWHARRVSGRNPGRHGTDMLLSLVDTHFNPAVDVPDYSLTAELLCTNRHLAETLPAGTRLDFERPGPVLRVSLLRSPHAQSLPALGGASRWRLVSQLTLNHLSLVEGEQALAALKEMLTLHNLRDEAAARRQIEGLSGITSVRIVERVGRDAWRGWRNGLEVRIGLDPQHFVGASPLLFSGVLAHFFSLYANTNRFVRTVLLLGDKEIKTWRPQVGEPLSL